MSDVVQLEPELGGAYGCRSSHVRGYYLRVNKCQDDDIWYFIDSAGKIELVAEDDIDVSSLTTISLAAQSVKVSGAQSVIVESAATVSITGGQSVSINAPSVSFSGPWGTISMAEIAAAMGGVP